MALDLAPIVIVDDVQAKDRTDARLRVYDANGTLQSPTVSIEEQDLSPQVSNWLISVTNLPNDYQTGYAIFDYPGDVILRPSVFSLVDWVLEAHTAVDSPGAPWGGTASLQALLESAGVIVDSTMDLPGAWAAAIADLEARTGRTFAAVTETRLFSGNGTDSVNIDPATAITAIAFVGTGGTVNRTLESNEFKAAPYNTATKTQLQRVGFFRWGEMFSEFGNYRSWWPYGTANIRVSATFGSALTADLSRAALYLAAGSLLLAWMSAAQGGTGLTGFTYDNISETYSGTGAGRNLVDQWRADADAIISRHARWRVG